MDEFTWRWPWSLGQRVCLGCLLLLLWACGPSDQLILHLHVKGLTPDVKGLRVHAFLDGQPASESAEFFRQLSDVTVILYRASLAQGGQVRIDLTGLDDVRCKRSAGSVDKSVESDQKEVDTEIVLSVLPQTLCTLTIDKQGNGTVSSPTSQASANPLNCGASCTADFVSGTTVQLVSQRGNGAFVTAFDGPCNSQQYGISGACAFQLSSSTTMKVDLRSGFCSNEGWCWQNLLPQGNLLRGVFGTDAKNVWAVGQAGIVLKWNGSVWSVQSSETTAALYAVWGTDVANLWAVGDAGTIVKAN